MSEAKALSNEQVKAAAHIDELVRECSRGGKDEEWLAEMLAKGAGLNVDEIHRRFEAARELWREAQKPKPVEPTEITPPSRDVKRPTLERSPLYRSLFTEGERAEIRARRAREKADVEAKNRVEAEARRQAEEPDQINKANIHDVPVEAGTVPGVVTTQALSNARELVPINPGMLVIPDFVPAAEAQTMVAKFNSKHAVIGNYGGRCMVLSYERWDVNPTHLIPTYQTFEAFKQRYTGRWVEQPIRNGTTRVSAAKYWLESPLHLQFEGVSFEPGVNAPSVLCGNRLNLWRRFAIEPERGKCELMLRHIEEILAAGDPKACKYIINWIAWLFQNLDKPAEVAPVLRGKQGTGKTLTGETICEILGPHAMSISQQEQFTGAFSGHLHQCCFLFADEAFWAGDPKIVGRMKNLITDKMILIRPLYVQAFTVRNRLKVMMASNNRWVVPAEADSRRFQVFDVSDKHQGDRDYFARLNEELDNEGRAAFLYELLRMPLGDWHPRETFVTKALTEQRQLSLNGIDRAIEKWLQDGMLPGAIAQHPDRAMTEDLLSDVQNFSRWENDPTALGNRLLVLFPPIRKIKNSGRTKRGWLFPPLGQCRKLWERANGGTWSWQEELDQWEDPTPILDRNTNGS